MKAAVFKGIESIDVEDVPEPEAGPSDLVVEVSACGICGSDLHTYQHGSFVQPGQIMGHEFAGRVVEAGDGVEGLAVGDRVTAVPIVPCGECARCARGPLQPVRRGLDDGHRLRQARRLRRADQDPALRFRARTSSSWATTITDEAGATVEPLAVAVHAVKLAGDVEGATALVLGLGTIGQQVVQVLNARGCPARDRGRPVRAAARRRARAGRRGDRRLAGPAEALATPRRRRGDRRRLRVLRRARRSPRRRSTPCAPAARSSCSRSTTIR